MNIRKASFDDIPAICTIYEEIHTAEESGALTIGWARGVYPTEDTANASLHRGDMFVLEEDGEIFGSAIINQIQVDVYADASWNHSAREDQVMVLHTLVISPRGQKRGYGKAFVAFYEDYARQSGCTCLRMDTNQKNTGARKLYAGLGYQEIGIVPCTFNGIEGVGLVLLEKHL